MMEAILPFGALMVLSTSRMFAKYKVGVARAQYYISQGISAVPGYDVFPFGNSKFAIKYFNDQTERKGKPLSFFLTS